MASSASAIKTRLSVNDWVQEGFRVLAEDGVKALTLGQLCSRLGVTKGSFYWHFSDMTAYRTALIDTWALVRDEDRSFDELTSLAPPERLSRMMTTLVGPRHWMLERAMREWARSEPTVAAAVRASDRSVLARRPAGLPRRRLRPRGVRDTRHRDFRRGHRLFASVRLAAESDGCRTPRATSWKSCCGTDIQRWSSAAPWRTAGCRVVRSRGWDRCHDGQAALHG